MLQVFNQYVSPKCLLLAGLESALILGAVAAGAWLRFRSEPGQFESYTAGSSFVWQALLIAVAFQTCFYYNDLYDLAAVRRRREQFVRLGQSLGAACLLLGLIYFLLPSLLIGRGVFFIAIVLAAAALASGRVALDRAWRAASPVERVAILGTQDLAQRVAAEIRRRDDLNLRLAGFVAEPGQVPDDAPAEGTVLGSASDLLRLAAAERLSRIIIAVEDRRGVLPVRELVRLRVQGIVIEDAPSALAALTGRVPVRTAPPSWFVFSDGFRRSKATLALKRLLDLAFALSGLALTAPLMLLIAAAVKLESRGPAIYRQERVGWKGATFQVLKFRSMRDDAEAGAGPQWARQNDPRLTRLGGMLRKYRLDELPQFINVLRGEMSFVGPRPERPVFVSQLREQIPFYDERHSVRPGLTGWAQIQYPYGASVEDAVRKLEYDLFYLKNLSVPFDCAIVFQTVRIVLFGQGAR